MKKQTIVLIIIGVVISVWLVMAMFEPTLTPNQIYREPSLTPTINFYREDIFDQCIGLESMQKLLKENPSLKINGNFQKDYQRILDNIERDKKILGMDNFKCP